MGRLGQWRQHGDRGEPDVADRNTISANDSAIVIGAGSGSEIKGNYIGVEPTGLAFLGNGSDGIWVGASASNVTIGGATEEERNVISGNNSAGIALDGDNNIVYGNYIGLDATGRFFIRNDFGGIRIANGSSGNTIGGPLPGQGNVISGNGFNGILISGSLRQQRRRRQHHRFGRRWINSVPNLLDGVSIEAGAQFNTIGGSTEAHRNLISGNSIDGVSINGFEYNSVLSNYIGLGRHGVGATDGILSWYRLEGSLDDVLQASNLEQEGSGLQLYQPGLVGQAIDLSGPRILKNEDPSFQQGGGSVDVFVNLSAGGDRTIMGTDPIFGNPNSRLPTFEVSATGELLWGIQQSG